MNILMLASYFPPEIGSASHLFYELGGELIRNGHQVTALTTFPRSYNVSQSVQRYRRKLFVREEMDGIRVIRVRSMPTPRDNIFARGMEHFILPFLLLLGGAVSGKQDAMLIYSPPLPFGITGYILSKVKRIPFVVNIQDLYPQAVIDLGLLKNRSLIRVFRAIERFVYLKANFLTVHSEGNRQYVISRGARADRVTVIHNWSDTGEIIPSPKLNEFRLENGLDGKFVVSYAGIISYSQDLETIIESAALLKDRSDVFFVVVGDGSQKEQLLSKASELKLDNVRFLPWQPKEKYAQVLSASDVCLVTLKKDKVSTPVVPRKLSDIMASGRPVIAGVPLDGDTPKIVEAAQCGLSVEPGNAEMLAQAILQLYENPALAGELGKNGRDYAEKHFSLDVCAREYEELFEKVCDVKRT